MATPEKLPSLAPYETDFYLNPTSFALTDELQCPANNVGIERTTQPSVARDDDDSDNCGRTFLQQQVQVPVHAAAEVGHHVAHLQSIGPKRQDAALRAPGKLDERKF